MGEMAAKALLTYIDPQTRKEMPATLIVKPDFVVRNSTAAVAIEGRRG
jgi:DNA-binding LacI/PurR family transcriptional regulator